MTDARRTPTDPDDILRACIGYPVAVVVAAVVSVGGMTLAYAPGPVSHPDHLTVLLVLVLAVAAAAALLVLPPFLAVRLLARRLGLHSPLYDIVCGGIIGLALGPSASAALPGLATDGVPDLAFRAAYLLALHRVGPFFLLGGTVGGLAYRLAGARGSRLRRGGVPPGG